MGIEIANYVRLFPLDDSGNVWVLDQEGYETWRMCLAGYQALKAQCLANGKRIYDETTEQWVIA